MAAKNKQAKGHRITSIRKKAKKPRTEKVAEALNQKPISRRTTNAYTLACSENLFLVEFANYTEYAQSTQRKLCHTKGIFTHLSGI